VVYRFLGQTFSTLIAPLIVGLTLQGVRGCDPAPIHALPSAPAACSTAAGTRHAGATWHDTKKLRREQEEGLLSLDHRGQ
jgi:hypothetical protein